MSTILQLCFVYCMDFGALFSALIGKVCCQLVQVSIVLSAGKQVQVSQSRLALTEGRT